MRNRLLAILALGAGLLVGVTQVTAQGTATEQNTTASTIATNQEATITILKAYHDAQLDYISEDYDGDGVFEYAQKILSTPGKKDGLYWNIGPLDPISPIGEIFSEASATGALDGSGYHGYHYRILTAQGVHAQGGSMSYIVKGHMTKGFAMIAWPVSYGKTGVMTFIISQAGQVYQKNLGPGTANAVKQIHSYNPDRTWKKVDIPD